MARRASDPVPITRPAVLAVEGDDEFYFLVELCRQEGIRERIHLYNLDGRDGLADKLEALAEADGFVGVTALGVMLDAEGTVADEVADRVTRTIASVFDPSTGEGSATGCPLPRPQRSSVFVAEECLEDMCLCPAPVQNDAAMPCVAAYLECIAHLIQDSTVGHASKRRV